MEEVFHITAALCRKLNLFHECYDDDDDDCLNVTIAGVLVAA